MSLPGWAVLLTDPCHAYHCSCMPAFECLCLELPARFFGALLNQGPAKIHPLVAVCRHAAHVLITTMAHPLCAPALCLQAKNESVREKEQLAQVQAMSLEDLRTMKG